MRLTAGLSTKCIHGHNVSEALGLHYIAKVLLPQSMHEDFYLGIILCWDFPSVFAVTLQFLKAQLKGDVSAKWRDNILQFLTASLRMLPQHWPGISSLTGLKMAGLFNHLRYLKEAIYDRLPCIITWTLDPTTSLHNNMTSSSLGSSSQLSIPLWSHFPSQLCNSVVGHGIGMKFPKRSNSSIKMSTEEVIHCILVNNSSSYWAFLQLLLQVWHWKGQFNPQNFFFIHHGILPQMDLKYSPPGNFGLFFTLCLAVFIKIWKHKHKLTHTHTHTLSLSYITWMLNII
jgi:hypothetical protein